MPPRYDPKRKRLDLSVGDLLWVERSSDPGGRLGGTEGGRRAHELLAERRAAAIRDFRREVPLSCSWRAGGLRVHLHARIDGMWTEDGETRIEEVKGVLDPAEESLPYPSHRMQAAIYAWIARRSLGVPAAGRVTLVSVLTGETREVPVEPEAGFEEELLRRVERIARFHRQREKRLHRRARSAERIVIPFPTLRPGQREMEEAVHKAVTGRRHLLLSAPPGSGKTAPLLLGALRECARNRLRLAFATSRTAQQPDRVRLLDDAVPPAARGRALVLTAGETLCPDHETTCLPHPERTAAPDPYDPPEWLTALLGGERVLTGAMLREAAARHGLCPRRVQLEAARHADLLIGDHNLLADPEWSPPGWFSRSGGQPDIILLVDEAHGLPDRIRDRRAVCLNVPSLRVLSEELPACEAPFARGAAKLAEEAAEEMTARLHDDGGEDLPRYERVDPSGEGLLEVLEPLAEALRLLPPGQLPAGALSAMDAVLRAVEVMRSAEGWAAFLDRADGGFCWELLEPGRVLARRWRETRCAIAFSATLSPPAYFLEELGLPAEGTDVLTFGDPFDPEQRRVIRYSGVSTRFRDREGDEPALARVLSTAATATGGVWLAFFPSRDYLRATEAQLHDSTLRIMTATEGIPLHHLMRAGGPGGGPTLLLATLGGKLAEGTGWPEMELDGIAVVGPGLPQVSPRRELLREHESGEGRGFQRAYLHPGLIRVQQAAGRLVRNENQQGVILLIGRRFVEPGLAAELPPEWRESPVAATLEELESLLAGRGTS